MRVIFFTLINLLSSLGRFCQFPWSLVLGVGITVFMGGLHSIKADNLAPLGSGIMGFNAAIDSNPGTLLFHGGVAHNINDGDLTTSVDDFSGGADGGQGVSFVGILWSTLRPEQITNLTLSL